MPVSYQIPPWIRGASPLEAAIPGAHLATQIAESNQRAAIAWAEIQNRQQQLAQHAALAEQELQQQQEFQQQRFQAQQQVQEQNQARADQKLQIENSYHQQQLALKQQQFDMTTKTAADKLAAQQQFLTQRETLKSGYINEEGMSPEDAESKATMQALFINGPAMGMSPTSLGAMARQAEGRQGEWKTSPGGANYYQTPGGPIHFEPKAVPQPRLQEVDQEIKDLTKGIQATQKELRDKTIEVQSKSDKDKQEALIPIQERLYNEQSKRHKLYQKKGTQPAAASPTAPVETAASDSSKPTFGAPKKGDVIGGYEFQGGDPSDQKNWKLPEQSDTEE